MKKVPAYRETHQKGHVSLENLRVIGWNSDDFGLKDVDLGVQIAEDGRVWVCINGVSFLRFSPHPDGKMSKTWEIWSEGFAITGEHGTHTLHGKAEGETFREACKNLAARDSEFAKNFNEEGLSYWGCSLFDNATDAARWFG